MSNRCFKKVHYRDCHQQFHDELTNLETQFRNAYTLKALEAQIAEKEADRIAQEAQEKLTAKLMTLQDEKIIEKEIKRNHDVSKKRKEYKQVLEDQIEIKIAEKLVKGQEERKERKVLIEVDRVIDEEYELMKKRNRHILAERMRNEQLILEEMREIKDTMEIEMKAAASKRDQKYQDEMEKRSTDLKKLRDEQIKKREILIETVAKLFINGDEKKRKRESIIADLVAEEIRQDLLNQERETERKIQNKKIQLAEDLKEQLMLLVISEERSRERDRIFTEEVMAKIMKDEKLEILTAEAKRRKQIDYKKELEKLINDKIKIHESTVAKYAEELKIAQLKEELQTQQLTEERQKLITEHVENIAKYLKSGVLSREEEEKFLLK